eukprot:g3175.t1
MYRGNWYFYTGKLQGDDLHMFEDDARIFSGCSNPSLAGKIAKFCGVKLSPLQVKRFSDGEVSIKVEESVRGKNVYIVQPVCRSDTGGSVNDALVELMLLVSTMRRASARTITALIPYYGYARQDRKMKSRVPISASDVARMISAMGVDRVVAVDLHCGQIQGFFPPHIPVDNLDAGPVGAAYFSEKNLTNPIIVSPDAGGVYRAKEFGATLSKLLHKKTGKHVDVGLAIIIKQRSGASQIESMDLVGDVKGRDCIICDDMIDTAGTLCKAAKAIKDKGANVVYAFATHALFSGPACSRIKSSVLKEVVVCDTVPLPKACDSVKKVTQLSLGPLLAETIKNIQTNSSVSKLFASHILSPTQKDAAESTKTDGGEMRASM